MARKKTDNVSSTYRFMCIREKGTNYTADFETREAALKYAEELDDSKIEWYGVYELNPNLTYLVTLVSKRLIPHEQCYKLPTGSKPERPQKSEVKRKRASRKTKAT